MGSKRYLGLEYSLMTMKMKKIKSFVSGFTLLELLVAMAVIAILIAIAIPSFRAMQTEGKKARAQGDLRTLQMAVETYNKDFGSYPPALGGGRTWEATLTACSPHLIDTILYDPLNPTPNSQYLYGINLGYYLIWSVGPKATSSTVGNYYMNIQLPEGTVWPSDPSVIWVTNGHNF
jgi:prepilin-type N-terminal cleavage/methylation domain-containing protein